MIQRKIFITLILISLTSVLKTQAPPTASTTSNPINSKILDADAAKNFKPVIVEDKGRISSLIFRKKAWECYKFRDCGTCIKHPCE